MVVEKKMKRGESMNRYYDFLNRRKKETKEKLKKSEKRAHKNYMARHKKAILFLDVLIIIAILFNFGAVTITNMLVVKDTPTKVFHEANPVTAERENYVTTPEANQHFYNFILTYVIPLGVLFAFYFRLRTKIVDSESYMLALLFSALIFIILGYDFFNNFGYYLGGILWQ